MDKPKSWVDMVGIWKESAKGKIHYLGPTGPPGGPPIGLTLNDGAIKKGEISCNVLFPKHVSEGRILFGYSSLSGKYYTGGIGGWDYGYSIQEFIPGFGWTPLKVAGDKANLKAGKNYSIEVEITGSKISLVIDNTRILEHILQEPIDGTQLGLFAYGNNEVIFKDYSFEGKKADIFVVMQLSEPYESLYRDVITPVCNETPINLNVIKATDLYSEHGIILQDIVKSIIEAEIIIAEITQENPNVFYELGYAQALKKPVILLAEKGRKLPFDIQGYRTLFYEDSIKGKNVIMEDLRKYLRAILNIREKS